MGLGLLWIEAQLTALLLVALTAAAAARMRHRWQAILLKILGVVPVLFVGLMGVTLSAFLHFKFKIEHDWMAYSASWLVVALIGIVVLFWRGAKKTEGVRAAANWPLKRLALGCLAAFVLTPITYWNIDTVARLKMAAIRHEATTIVMSISPPSVPDSENAALIYEKAFEVLSAKTRVDIQRSVEKTTANKKGWDKWASDFNKVNFPAKDPHFIEYIQQRQGAVALLKRASAVPACTFDRDFRGREMISMLLPELGKMREGARVLAADARWKAADGKIAEAFEDIVAIDGMAAHVGAQPILITALVASAIEAIASNALEGVLLTTTPTAADLAILSKDNPARMERILYRALKGEEAFGLATFADFAEDLIPTESLEGVNSNEWQGARYIAPSIWRVFLVSDDIDAYRHFMEKMRESVSPNAELRYFKKTTFKEGRAKLKDLENELRLHPKGVLTALMTPVMTRAIESLTRSEAQQRLRKLAVAMVAYRSKNKQWPEKADALVPDFIAELPLDPFDNQPLRYKKTGEAILLYSVGPEMVDDGGEETPPKKTSESGAGPSRVQFRLGAESGTF